MGYEELTQKYNDLSVKATQDLLWTKLTGQTQSASVLGGHPFQLLCAIARNREKGISNIDLHLLTGQDQRSLTGRVNTLQDLGLVKKYPIVEKGAWTYLNVYWKYIDVNREQTEMRMSGNRLDITNIRRIIMEKVKSAQNGIRLLHDLRVELGFTASQRMKVNFTSAVRKLARQGYLERIYVYKPEIPDKKYYCIRFLKDLPADDDYESDDEDDGDYVDGDDIDLSTNNRGADDSKLKENYSTMDVVSTTNQESSSLPSRTLFNLFFTLESQITHLIYSSKTTGAPGIEIIQKLTGSSYDRVVTQSFTLLSGSGTLSSAKLQKYTESPNGYMTIMRGVDMAARTKYYRYFWNCYFVEFTNEVKNPIWGEFMLPKDTSIPTLLSLEKKHSIALGGKVPKSFLNDMKEIDVSNSKDANKKRVSVTGKKLGRPRKNAPKPAHDSNATENQNLGSNVDTLVTEQEVSREKTMLIPPAPVENISPVIRDSSHSTASTNKRSEPLYETSRGVEPPLKKPKQSLIAMYFRNKQSPDPKTPSAESSNTLKSEQATLNKAVEDEKSNKAASDQLGEDTEMSDALPENIRTVDTESIEGPTPKNRRLEDFSASNASQAEKVADQTLSSSKQSKYQLETPVEKVEGDFIEIDTVPSLPQTRFKQESSPGPETKYELGLSTTRSISLVMMKRINQIMQLFRENNGILQGGMKLVHAVNKRFGKENSGTMDRKTVSNTVEHLIKHGEIWKTEFSYTNPKSEFVIKKSILFHKSIIRTEALVEQLKQEVIDEGRVSAPIKGLRVAEFDFKLYSIQLLEKQETRRLAREKRANEGRKSASLNKAQKRLAVTDNERRVKMKRKRTRIGRRAPDIIESRVLEREANELVNKLYKTKGNDPMLSLPLSERHIRNSKRITSAKPELRVNTRAYTKNMRQKAKIPVSDDMFFRLVIIVKMFFADGNGVIDWNRVAQYTPGYTAKQVQSYWGRIRTSFKEHKGTIRQVQMTFEKMFLQAYEDGEIPIIENIEEYDLMFLAKFWIRKHPKIFDQTGVPLLLNTIDSCKEKINFSYNEPVNEGNGFYRNVSMIKYEQQCTEHSLSIPKRQKEPEHVSEYESAKIAIKSIIATVDENYSKDTVESILNKLGKVNCAKATQELDNERLISFISKKESNPTERNFVFSDNFMSKLNHRFGTTFLFDLNKVYREIEEILNQSKGMIVSRLAEDFSMITLLDLVGYEKIDLVRVNMPQSIDTIQNSRRIDKNIYECDMVVRTSLPPGGIEANPKFVPYFEKTVRDSGIMPPVGSVPCSNIWTDITGRLSRPMFRRIVHWILQYVNSHPGATEDLIMGQIGSVINRNEFSILIDWLLKKGILNKHYEETEWEGFWTANEWYVDTGVL